MEKKTLIISMVLGNCFLFGMVGYAVFLLGHSGWWFAMPILVHFSVTDFYPKKDNENNED